MHVDVWSEKVIRYSIDERIKGLFRSITLDLSSANEDIVAWEVEINGKLWIESTNDLTLKGRKYERKMKRGNWN